MVSFALFAPGSNKAPASMAFPLIDVARQLRDYNDEKKTKSEKTPATKNTCHGFFMSFFLAFFLSIFFILSQKNVKKKG